MALRFHKSIKILPGVRLNINKGSLSLTAGIKGAHYTVSTKGTGTASVGIPGSGLSYQKKMKLFDLKKLFSGFGKKDEETEAVETAETAEASVVSSSVTPAEPETLPEEVAVSSEDLDETFRNYTEYMESITSLHKECSGEINWNNVAAFSIPEGCSAEDMMKYQSNIVTAQKILAGDIDTYLEMMEKHSPFKELAGYGSDFEFGTEDPKKMEVEFTVNFNDVVPDYTLKKTAAGISQAPLSKTAYYDRMQDYVCSCTIKVAREIFALLPVDEILVHACDTMLDTSTGNNKEITILSVRFRRDMFQGINYAMIDPSDFVDRFEKKDGFRKTAGYQEVSRLV